MLEKNEGTNEFQQFHNEMRQLNKPRMFYSTLQNKRRPYVRERTDNEIEGKKNIRAAKRARVKLLKGESNVRSS